MPRYGDSMARRADAAGAAAALLAAADVAADLDADVATAAVAAPVIGLGTPPKAEPRWSSSRVLITQMGFVSTQTCGGQRAHVTRETADVAAPARSNSLNRTGGWAGTGP